MTYARARDTRRRTGDDSQSDDGSLGAAIDAVRRAPAEQERAPLAREVATDWGQEREADAVADVAARDFRGPALDGDRLSAGLQDAMQAAKPELGGLGAVRFDESEAASRAADSIDALAFTRGTDVAVARGEMSPHLAAHEAAHAAMHDDGAVHAKLRGTRDALQNLGGPPADKIFTTNWEKILEGVGAYESIEEALLKDGNPAPQQMQTAKPQLVKTLTRVQGSIKSWHKANDSKKEAKKTEEKHAKTKETAQQVESDERSKAGRRQAIAMLEPRVGNELNLLQSKDSSQWLGSLGLSQSKVSQQGQDKAGGKNQTKELRYQTESGEFAGYFKQEKGFAKDLEMHEIDTGIRQVDPNYGARAVAMYKIDQILKAGVTARAEFATHVDKEGKTVMGTVLESAKGTEGGSLEYGMNKEHAKQIGGVSLDDPKLQQGLNKLQVLDAICGQLDRHAGNYYIETDEQGNVVGVTGIDLDMAFGQDMMDPESREANMAQNYRGFPAYVDAEFGRAILQIAPGTIQDALTGLLPPAEVNAAVRRFIWVRKKIQELAVSEKLVEKWGPETLGLGSGITSGKNTKFQSGLKTYGDNLTQKSVDGMVKHARGLLRDAVETGSGPRPFNRAAWRDVGTWPKEAREALVTVIGRPGQSDEEIAYAVYDNKVTDRIEEVTMLLLNDLLADPIIEQFAVFCQEKGADQAATSGWDTRIGQVAKSKYIAKAIETAKKRVKPSEEAKQTGRKSMLGSRGR